MHRIFTSLVLFCTLFLVAIQPAHAATLPTVTVGNPGNPVDENTVGRYGSVGYVYQIGLTEVSNSQYVEFLNAKAASDPLGLYNTEMGSGFGGITRSGADGSYSYSTIVGRENKPVNFVSWYDAIRFANWLNNGQGSGDTETGAYTVLGGTPIPSNGSTITRNPGAIWFLPSEDEWHKAAYHRNDGIMGNYFQYPTNNNAVPIAEAPPGGSNSVNYDSVVGDLTDVGAYTGTISPYGAFDMGGNVWEWTEASDLGGALRIVRGGSFLNGSDSLHSPGRGNGTGPFSADFLGFRVATVPEPGTVVLAVIGCGLVLAMLRRSKHFERQ